MDTHPTAARSDTAPSSSLEDSNSEADSLVDSSSEDDDSENGISKHSSIDDYYNDEPKSPSHEPQHDNCDVACAPLRSYRVLRKHLLQVNKNIFGTNVNKHSYAKKKQLRR